MHFDVDDRTMSDADMSAEESVNQRLVRRDVAVILACEEKTLGRRRRLLPHKQVVMRTVWKSPLTKELLPEARRVSAKVQAREGIVLSLLQSLSEVKTSKTRAQCYQARDSNTCSYEWIASLCLPNHSFVGGALPKCGYGGKHASDDGQ